MEVLKTSEFPFTFKYFMLFVSVGILISTVIISFADDTVHYKGSKWMSEREALYLVLENNKFSADFEIIGEGNPVELKYNFHTKKKMEDFEVDTDSWWDRNGINSFFAISGISFIIFVCLMIIGWINNFYEKLLEKAKNGKR